MKKSLLLFVFLGIYISSFAQESNSLQEKSKTILNCFVTNNFAELPKYFDETMNKQLPPKELKKVWNELILQAGSFSKSTSISNSVSGQYKIVFLTCIFQKVELKLKVVFNKEEQVAGLWFLPDNSAPCSSGFYEKAKAILTCFEKSDFTRVTKYFNETMRNQLPSEKLKEAWNMLNQNAGPYIKSSTQSDAIYQQYKIVYIICIFQNEKLKLKVVFDKNCEVGGLFFVPENQN